jgi:hypothetical protein
MRGSEAGSAAATFLATIAAFAVGIGAGWLLFAGDGEPRESVSASETAPAPAAPGSAAAQPGAPRARAGERAAALDAAGQRALTAAANVQFDFPGLAGSGVIRGTVKTEAGEPIPGVEIRAFAYTPPEWNAETKGRTFDEIPLDETLRQTVRNRRWWEASRKTATTAADGTFELTGLAEVNWSVSAHSEGYTFTAPAGGTDPARAGQRIQFVASRSVKFDLVLRLPDGTSPRRARVSWTVPGSNGTTGSEWWPGAEFMEMKPGKWRVSATGGDDVRFASPPTDVELRPGMDPLVLTLRPRAGIVVVAKRPEDLAALRVRFFLARAEGSDPTDDELRTSKTRVSPFDDEGVPDELFQQMQGTWSVGDRRSFLDLEPGRWVVAAGFDGAALGRRVVTVGEGAVECEIAVPAPDPSQFVEVRVIGPEGAAPASVRLEWEYRAARESASYSAEAIARGGGVWQVRRVGAGDRPQSSEWSGPRDLGGRWYLQASVDGFVREEAEAAPGAARVEIRLRVPAIAVVRLTGLPPGIDTKRFVPTMEDEGHAYISAETGPVTRLGPVAPGRHQISLSVSVGQWSTLRIERRAVDLVAGENVVEFAVPQLHPLDLDLGALQGARRCSLEPVIDGSDPDSAYVELDDAGRAKLDLVPAGRYRLRVDEKEHEFSVPQTRTFKLP